MDPFVPFTATLRIVSCQTLPVEEPAWAL